METATDTELDMNKMVELAVHDAKLANQAPNSRWGRIKFDENGDAVVKVPLKDVEQLHHLKWLSEEDKEKYLGILPQASPMEAEASKLIGEMDALRAANTLLASKNAQLEADMQLAAKKYDSAFAEYEKACQEKMEALVKENEELRAQLASATAPVTTESKPEETKADTKASKKGK